MKLILNRACASLCNLREHGLLLFFFLPSICRGVFSTDCGLFFHGHQVIPFPFTSGDSQSPRTESSTPKAQSPKATPKKAETAQNTPKTHLPTLLSYLRFAVLTRGVGKQICGLTLLAECLPFRRPSARPRLRPTSGLTLFFPMSAGQTRAKQAVLNMAPKLCCEVSFSSAPGSIAKLHQGQLWPRVLADERWQHFAWFYLRCNVADV